MPLPGTDGTWLPFAPRTLDTVSAHDTQGSGPLDLNLLRTFLGVHRLGSFPAAARQLSVSQSTVTTQIRALEHRLGHELFERRAQGVSPLPHADELATRLSAPLDQLAVITGEEPGSTVAPVHLAGPAEFMSAAGLKVLAPLIALPLRFQRKANEVGLPVQLPSEQFRWSPGSGVPVTFGGTVFVGGLGGGGGVVCGTY